RWAIAGVPVVIGSRSAERAADAAEKAQERTRVHGATDVAIEGLHNDDAVKRAGTVVLAVPFRTQAENLNNLGHSLQPGTVLVDATVPLAAAIGGRATRSVGGWEGPAGRRGGG